MAGSGPGNGRIGRLRGRWPAGLVGMLALVAAVEAGVVRLGREIGTLTSADWRRDRQAAASEAAAGAEVLCFGDSLVKTGVTPAALEARLDRPVYNLAALGSPVPASYFLLRRALDAGARPRAIVLDANEPQLWGSPYRNFVAAWAELVNPIEALQLARDDGDLGFFSLYLTNLLPSVRFRLDLRKAVVGGVAGRPREPSIPWDPVVVRHYRRNRGAILFQPTHAMDGPDPYPNGLLPPDDAELYYRTGPMAHRDEPRLSRQGTRPREVERHPRLFRPRPDPPGRPDPERTRRPRGAIRGPDTQDPRQI